MNQSESHIELEIAKLLLQGIEQAQALVETRQKLQELYEVNKQPGDKTQVGTASVLYRNPRTTYDWQQAVKEYEVNQELRVDVSQFTKVSETVAWAQVAKSLGIETAPIKSQAPASIVIDWGIE